MPKTYTVKEVADILGYSTNSIYTFLKEKRIKGVRVGRGRFRVPEEELARVLHLSKKTFTASLAGEQPQTAEKQPVTVLPVFWSAKESSFNLFDWFVGGSAMLVAATSFIFCEPISHWNYQWIVMWLIPLRLIFLLCGAGVLFADFTNAKRAKPWRKIFLFLLAVGFSCCAFFHYFSGTMELTALYGVLVLTIILHLLFNLSETAGLATLGLLIGAATPVVVLLWPESIWLPLAAKLDQVARLGLALIWSMGWIELIYLAWIWGQFHPKRSSVISGLLSALMVGLAIYHASYLHWSSAALVLLAGVMFLVLPFWYRLKVLSRRDRPFIFGAYLGVLVVFLLSLVIVWGLQQSRQKYAEKELLNKIQYGQKVVVDTIASDRRALESLAANPAFVSALTEKKLDLLAGLSRSIFEGGRTFQAINILNKEGDLLLNYPLGTVFTVTNFAFRDYFIQAVNTRKSYLTDVIELKAIDRKKVMVISTPVIDSKKEIVGVLAGIIDIQALVLELDKIGNAANRESFGLTDKAGQWIVSPGGAANFQKIPPAEEKYRAAVKENAVVSVESDGILWLTARQQIPDLGWSLILRASLAEVLRTAVANVLIILGIFSLSCVVLLSVFALRQVYEGKLLHLLFPDEKSP